MIEILWHVLPCDNDTTIEIMLQRYCVRNNSTHVALWQWHFNRNNHGHCHLPVFWSMRSRITKAYKKTIALDGRVTMRKKTISISTYPRSWQLLWRCNDNQKKTDDATAPTCWSSPLLGKQTKLTYLLSWAGRESLIRATSLLYQLMEWNKSNT